MPGGAGWLIDSAGNDRYYSKGKRATNYGEAGIFDSWSQGSAVGFAVSNAAELHRSSTAQARIAMKPATSPRAADIILVLD